MINEVKTHKLAYSILITAMITFIMLFLHFWPDRIYQRFIAILMGIFYFIWGITVHNKHKHINRQVILEYFAISVLAVSLLLLLLN